MIIFPAGEAGVSGGGELGGHRTVFLSVHGGAGGGQIDGLNLGLFLGYVVPLTSQGIIDQLLMMDQLISHMCCRIICS